MQVWVLAISHKYGTNISVHASQDGAHAHLVSFCTEEWDGEIRDDIEKPDDADEMIMAYFEYVSDEYYEIAERAVIGDGQCN